MYLFAFIFLLLSIIGLYTEVHLLQVARIFANQKSIAEIMITWHSSGKTLAHGFAIAGPCLLTPSPRVVYGINPCPSPLSHSTVPDPLPAGYNDTAYAWNSVYYTSGGARYVLTYVPPPPGGNASAPVLVPPVGYTLSELDRQLRNTELPPALFGTVQMQGTFKVLVTHTGMAVPVPMPVATGSLGIIGAP